MAGGIWRRIRGAIGLGLTWALGWGIAGVALGVVLAVIFPAFLSVPASAITTAIGLGTFGFFGGLLFSAVLRLTDGSRVFHELSLPRFTGWGAVGGALLGGVVVGADLIRVGDPVSVDVVIVGILTLLGAASAGTTLAIARRGDDQALLRERSDVEGAGLTEKERNSLLGQPE